MGFPSWLRNLQSAWKKHRNERSRLAPGFRPRLEALEDRTVPAQISLTVTSLADAGAGTLRAAIAAADAGSHSDKFFIDFAATGTIDLQSSLPDLNNNIAIQGPGASSLTVQRDLFAPQFGVFTVDRGATVSISGLTINQGQAPVLGGGVENLGSLTISVCTLTYNTASFGGGIDNGGSLTVNGCSFGNDFATSRGGGIANEPGGTATIAGSTFSDNFGSFGGGGIWNDGSLTVSASTFTLNDGLLGGGIDNDFDSAATVNGSTFTNNGAEYGGGIYNYQATLTVGNSTLSANSAGFAGAGIFNDFLGIMTVSGCTLCGNTADGVGADGGGIFNTEFGTLTVSSSTFSGNSADGFGGGIANDGTLTVRDSSFTSNSAALGGGIDNDSNATLDVRGSTFSANTASDSGGGIYNLGTATLQECTLSENTAGANGGGVFNAASGTLAVKDSTVLHNMALLGADIYNLGTLTLNDSIVGIIGP